MFSEALLTHRFDRISQWQKYKESLCRNCFSLCCRLPVEVNADDLVRLELADAGLGDERKDLKRAARQLEAKGIVRSFRAQSGLFTLNQKPNGDCVFLDSEHRVCTVYDKRPGVCRRFPQVGPRPGFCPHVDKSKVGSK